MTSVYTKQLGQGALLTMFALVMWKFWSFQLATIIMIALLVIGICQIQEDQARIEKLITGENSIKKVKEKS